MGGSLNSKVREYVQEMVGEEGMRVVNLLEERQEATDTEIAEELDAKPSHVRKVLYDLYANRVAEYHKEKDKETGWLTFFWELTPEEADEMLDQRREDLIGELEEALKFEEEHDFYVCPTGGERYDFPDAMELEFHCPEHGDNLEHLEENENIDILMQRIQQLREQGQAEG